MVRCNVRLSYQGQLETKKNLRKLFLISLPVQALFQVITIVSVAVGPVRSFMLGRVIGVEFNDEDLVPQIFSDQLPVMMAVYILIGTVLITGILAYVIWATTKPRNTFNERRYFR